MVEQLKPQWAMFSTFFVYSYTYLQLEIFEISGFERHETSTRVLNIFILVVFYKYNTLVCQHLPIKTNIVC